MIFAALSDSTRRSILERVSKVEMSIGEIAKHYKLTFAAIAKHIAVLERAGFIIKKRQGKEQVVVVVPHTMDTARHHIERYALLQSKRFSTLESLLQK